MNLQWTDEGWEDYLYWQKENRKILKRVNDLIKDANRNGNQGIGQPELLTGNWKGYWSRRIDEKNRLVYKIEAGVITIAQCRSHYGDK